MDSSFFKCNTILISVESFVQQSVFCEDNLNLFSVQAKIITWNEIISVISLFISVLLSATVNLNYGSDLQHYLQKDSLSFVLESEHKMWQIIDKCLNNMSSPS